jgi:hypothetical protein
VNWSWHEYGMRVGVWRFFELYRRLGIRPTVAIAIHPYISGQPHRIRYLEEVYDYVNRFEGVLHWNGAEILDWYRATSRVVGAS